MKELIKNLVFIKEEKVLTNSRIVAEYFGKQHKHVMRDIRNLEENGVPNFGLGSYVDTQNQERPMFTMDRDGFTLLAMGFTGGKALTFKLAYIEAFNVMEKELKNKVPALPQTYVEALRQLADTEEQKQLALAKIEADKPKVEHMEKFIESSDNVSLTDACKSVGLKPNKTIAVLRDKGYLTMKNLATSKAIDKGFFVVVTNTNDTGFSYSQTKVTHEGIMFLGRNKEKIENMYM